MKKIFLAALAVSVAFALSGCKGANEKRGDEHLENQRYRNAINSYLDALKKGGAQGKNLGFILQEMGREANTLGTKCQSAEIAALAIELKNEIECIREQSLNIA